MSYFRTRITDPGSNQQLHISDLIERLRAIQAEHGDLLCYVYSSDKRALVPMIEPCVQPATKPAGMILSVSGPVGTVVDEMCADLSDEIARLRAALEVENQGGLTSLPPDACGGQIVDNERRAAAGAGEADRWAFPC